MLFESAASGNPDGRGLLHDREVGREKFGGLEGGEDVNSLRGELGVQSRGVGASEDIATGESGRKGPSNAVAGDTDLLPGMVGRPPGLADGEEWSAIRISGCTEEVSHRSNALSEGAGSFAG